MRKKICVLAVAVCCTAVWLIAADVFNVKTGLWETTTVSETSGRPPIPPEVLAKLTPEQRAQMEQRMKASQAAGPRTSTSKTCVTQEDLAKALTMGTDTGSCTRRIISSSANKQEFQFDCAQGGYKQTGTVRIEATSRESMQGSVEFTMSGNGNTMTNKSKLTGKWLSSDCGGVGH